MDASKLAIFGDPVAHSLSPLIHEAFAKQYGLSLTYEKIPTPQGHLQSHWDAFLQQGGWGANITTPLKTEAMSLVTVTTPLAQSIGALNTLFRCPQQKQWMGDNTDGEGFIRYLNRHLHFDLTGMNILLLGAGNAARALVHAFLSSGFKTLTIINRDGVKAARLKIQENINIFSYTDFNSLAPSMPIDIIINATSCQFTGMLPPMSEKCLKDKLIIDLSYSAVGLTSFLQWAKQHQAKQVHDGLGMLIEQAALSFELWFNRRPDTLLVYQKMRLRE